TTYYMIGQEIKTHLSVAVFGEVNAGKSTTVGHLIYSLKGNRRPRITTHVLDGDKDGEMGKKSLKFAWLMDTLKAERERGITIETSFGRFETPRHTITVIDTPGHRDFIKNMITGTSQSDCGIFVVCASNRQPDTANRCEDHLQLAYTLGVRHLIVAINKMDEHDIYFNQDKYTAIIGDIGTVIRRVGFKSDQTVYIPISGLDGDNLMTKSSRIPWYQGPTLLEALDNIEAPICPPTNDKPLRIPIQEVFKIKGIGTLLAGRVESGILELGMQVTIVPPRTGLTVSIKSIEMHHQSIVQATPGDNVAFCVTGAANLWDINKGAVVGSLDNPPKQVQRFIAQVVIIQHPQQIHSGYTPCVHYHSSRVSCQISIINRIDRNTGLPIQYDTPKIPIFLVARDLATVEFTPMRPICVSTYDECQAMGRIVIRDMGVTVGVGIIKKVIQQESVG
ncbi:hypothetical protein SAMD00019534_033860, partial [Acytostelium subglobosum LB1]|uniref:hypothetical protein n=1 Tax=Acytostelium subglobosum LB1 TaxID=1410327 RepID=UPI000644EE42